MRVNKIFFITVFMCAFTTGIVNARTLHFGDKTIALSQTKYTTPSLAFGIGNETWYAPLTTEQLTNTIHIKLKNLTFSLDTVNDYDELLAQYNCPQIFTDVENYTYDENGRLIGADENLWIQGNGGYIDTGFIADSETRIKAKIYNTNATTDFWFFESRQSSNQNTFGLLCPAGNNTMRNDYGTQLPFFGAACAIQGIFIADKNKNSTTVIYPNGNIYTQTVKKQTFTTPHSMLIGAGWYGPGIDNSSKWQENKRYYFQIWDNGVLVRDMVPVPACMRIGDFIVPENGMWDIVEQKFYGNANSTGTIIYGRDE